MSILADFCNFYCTFTLAKYIISLPINQLQEIFTPNCPETCTVQSIFASHEPLRSIIRFFLCISKPMIVRNNVCHDDGTECQFVKSTSTSLRQVIFNILLSWQCDKLPHLFIPCMEVSRRSLYYNNASQGYYY